MGKSYLKSESQLNAEMGTIAKSLPEDGVIFLTLLISKRYISYTELRKKFGKTLDFPSCIILSSLNAALTLNFLL